MGGAAGLGWAGLGDAGQGWAGLEATKAARHRHTHPPGTRQTAFINNFLCFGFVCKGFHVFGFEGMMQL